MKNTIKLFLATFLFIGFTSCEDEQDLLFTTPPASFSIVTPETNTSVVMTADNPTNPALTVTWQEADYGTATAVTYELELCKDGNNFVDIFSGGTTNAKNITWSVQELNTVAISAQLVPFIQGAMNLRVKASTGTTGSQPTYSNVINILLTPFTTELPKICVPGNHQGWTPSTAPRMAAAALTGADATNYEGYMWLDGGYKFVAPDAGGNFNWGNPDWGDNGDFSGILKLTDEQNCTATAGYYRVQANTTALTYNATAISWGIIGAATPTGWDSDTDLTYNSTTKKLEIASIALTAGEFKFRANNAWAINLGGPADSLAQDGGNLSVATAGNYKVELDLSNPRKYTYTLTAL